MLRNNLNDRVLRVLWISMFALAPLQVTLAGNDPNRCAAYASTAAAQGRENRERGCGWGGSMWDVSYDSHYGMCLAGLHDAGSNEIKFRAQELAKCRAQASGQAPDAHGKPSGANSSQVVERRDSGARFSSLSREVEVRRGYNPEEIAFATMKTILYVGDEVITGEDSNAVISFADLSTIFVKAESRVVIAAPPESPGRLELIKGRLLINLQKTIRGAPLEVNTNLATVGVKGTVVEIFSDGAHRTLVSVLEGLVQVTSKVTKLAVPVAAGQQILATTEGPKPVEAFDPKKGLESWRQVFTGEEMTAVSERVSAAARSKMAKATPPAAARQPDEAARPEPSKAEAYGFWAVSEGADGVKVGVVFPDYSATEFAGAVLYCVRRSGVRISIDSPRKLKAGSKATVSIEIDGASTVYKGTAQNRPTEDGSVVVVDTTFSDPLFEELSSAKSVGFAIEGTRLPLPTKNLQNSFGRFFRACMK